MYPRKSVLYKKAFAFSIQTIELCKLFKKRKEYEIASQLLRSSTSIGANIKESQYAQSKRDFISKMSIALKEAGETEYWLELLLQTKLIEKNKGKPILKSLKEIIKMLISSVKTAKKNLNK